jgi:hypothetical protein
MRKKTIHKTRKVGIIRKAERKILGVTANVKNLLIAIVMLFAFLGGFFQVYNWVDTTYTRYTEFKVVKAKQDFSWENDILKGMYSRYYVLDNIVNLAPIKEQVPENLKTEFKNLGKEISLQEDKVKLLQKNLCK